MEKKNEREETWSNFEKFQDGDGRNLKINN